MATGYLLLVTWIVFNQAPASYQVQFQSLADCQAAKAAVEADATRVKTEAAKPPANLPPGTFYNPGPPPVVSALCVVQ